MPSKRHPKGLSRVVPWKRRTRLVFQNHKSSARSAAIAVEGKEEASGRSWERWGLDMTFSDVLTRGSCSADGDRLPMVDSGHTFMPYLICGSVPCDISLSPRRSGRRSGIVAYTSKINLILHRALERHPHDHSPPFSP